MINLDPFTRAYVECALRVSTDESTPSGGDPLDKNYTIENISVGTLYRMITDCRRFRRENAHNLKIMEAFIGTWSAEYSAEERCGHDFWLSRNGHGDGFFDRDAPDDVKNALQAAARAFGGFNLYVGDDGLIYGA